MREGGLGLPLFAVIGTLAYQASAGIIDATQHAATTAFYESLRTKLDAQIVNHLKSWEHQYASMWLRKFGALEDEACPVTFGFGGSLRLRLGLHLTRADWKCVPTTVVTCPGCGKMLQGIAPARAHAVRCAKWSGGYGPTNRHHLLRDSLASVLQDTGATVSTEFQIGQNRMDLVVTSIEGKHYWFDVGVTSEKPDDMYKEKIRTYTALSEQHDAEFHPLVFNLEAKPHPQCRSILNQLACDFDIPKSRLMSAAVAAIMSGNGLITSKAEAYVRQCAGRAPATATQQAIIAPVPEVEVLRDDAHNSLEVIENFRATLEPSTIDAPEIAWATRVVPPRTFSLGDEAGCIPLLLKDLSSQSSGAAKAAYTPTAGRKTPSKRGSTALSNQMGTSTLSEAAPQTAQAATT
jgi:hypothetical protein